MKKLFLITSLYVLVACTPNETTNTTSSYEVLTSAEVNWEKLNPARGDASPQAATLWGDRNGSEATGFLVKFVDGFSSPPHIHNVSYRGVVIKGLVHNDDPEAAQMWMPEGSFWTQPAGEAHITSAKGKENIAFIEIEKAPYLVMPTEKAFDNGERPVNVDASNIVWVDFPVASKSQNNSKRAYLWGKPEQGLNGTLLKLPVGFKGTITSKGSSLHAVVIQGQVNYQTPESDERKVLDAGSYFQSDGTFSHSIVNPTSEECVLYIRANGRFEVE